MENLKYTLSKMAMLAFRLALTNDEGERKSKLSSVMKHSKAIDAATIARLLSHEDEHGMGRVFMYAFVNEVIRQKRPFSFDCDSAQIIDVPVLSVVDKEGRSITINHKRNRLSLILDDKRPDAVNQIIFKGKEYRLVMFAWLIACIRYTSLQPELRNKLSEYVQSFHRSVIIRQIRRTIILLPELLGFPERPKSLLKLKA